MNMMHGMWYQAAVLDALKTAQEKYGDADGLRYTTSLIEKLYRDHDELDRDDLGDVSDDASDESSAGDDDDDDINLDEISDDSGHDAFLLSVYFSSGTDPVSLLILLFLVF